MEQPNFFPISSFPSPIDDHQLSVFGVALVVSLLFLCWTAAVKLPLISGINVGLVALLLNFAMVGLITLPSQFGQRLRQSGRELADR